MSELKDKLPTLESLKLVNDTLSVKIEKNTQNISQLTEENAELKSDLGNVINQLTSDIPVITKIGVVQAKDGKVFISPNVDTWTYSVVDISECINKTLSITTGSDRLRPIIFADNDGNVISTYIHDTGNQNLRWDIDVDVPDGATLLYVNHPNFMELPLSISGIKKREFARIDEVPEKISIAQTTGTSQTAVMSQKAVTDAVGLEVVATGKNLFNLDAVTHNKNFNSSGGFIDSSIYSASDYIKVDGNTVYSLQGINSGGFNGLRVMRYIFEYDEEKNIIKNTQNVSTVTTSEATAYVRFSFSVNYDNADAQTMFFVGDSVSDYEPYHGVVAIGKKVKAENVLGLVETVTVLIDAKVEEAIVHPDIKKMAYSFRQVDAVCDQYSNESATVTIPKDSGNRYIDPMNNIYALYDELVANYPEYVTRTLMGTVLPETEALPIYRYDFAPPMLLGSKTDDVCKILYCSGIHGGEVAPILQGFRFFKDLCENWRNQELLRSLRFNVHFTVIPIVNPYGIQHNQKTNENGVNLNRNFTNGWVYDAGDGTSASSYSGETPASELATQLIENMIANERFEFGIDHHTFSNFVTAGYVGYFVSNDAARQQDKSFADLVGTWISSKVVTNNTLITDLSKSYFRTTAGNLFKGYLYGAFPSGYCFESVFAWGDEQMEALYECQKFGAEILGGIFHSALVGYHTY